MKTKEMVDEAAAMLSKEDAESFSISTMIPKDWLVREEAAWDRNLRDKTESLKNMLNRSIAKSLREKTSLPYVSDGDCRAVFDYKTGKASIERNALFIFGRYRKHVTGISQSRWICARCGGKGCEGCRGKGKNYESVEEKIGEPVKRAAQAVDYVMHASGREDVDATNSAGRAFVLEVKEPGKRAIELKRIAGEIAEGKEVSVSGLKIVKRGFVELVTESHFDKTYRAEIEFEKEITADDRKMIEGIEGKTILQRTPSRVAHRRADLVRHRKIKEIKVVDAEGRRAVLEIKAEAGTYIKELVSGDNGRTEPSITGLVSAAECKSLEVTKIEDEYIDFCL